MVLSNHSKGHVFGGLAARVAGRPAIWWQHGTPEHSPLERAAAHVPAEVVIAGNRSAVEAHRQLKPRRRVELVHPGVDLSSLRKARGSGRTLRESYGWGSAPLVGIVGRLQEWKGQHVFLRAAARLADVHPDVVFLVVGGAILGWEGDYPERLRYLAANLGLEKRVVFTGHQDEVYPWLDALDIVVHASLDEPFGLVLLEAMALGKPLIATAAAGPTEIVQDGTSGLLVGPGDDEAMAEAIARVLDDEDARVKLAAGASRRAAAFDENQMVEQFVRILNEVVGRFGTSVRKRYVRL